MTSSGESPVFQELRDLVAERIVFMDGAMGTMIQAHSLGEDDYRGERFASHGSPLKGNNDLLCLTQPAVIRSIHEAYLEVGTDILETNTFNATSISQADYALESVVYELNLEAARLARAAVKDSARELRNFYKSRVKDSAFWGSKIACFGGQR